MNTFDDAEFWKKAEEESRLRDDLHNVFPEYAFLIDINMFLWNIAFIKSEIAATKDSPIASPDPSVMLSILRRVSLWYFAAFSTQLSYECYFYEKTKTMKGNAQTDFHPAIDEWKRSSAVKLVKSVRNRFQHGALLNGTLRYQERTKHHPSGPGHDVLIIDDNVWKDVVDSPEYIALLVDKDDKLFELLECYSMETKDLVDRLRVSFSRKFCNELAQRQEIIDAIAKIDAWFTSKGFVSPHAIMKND